MTPDPYKPLRDDLRLLGELLGDTLKADAGDEVLRTVERVRALAKSARTGNDEAFGALADVLARMSLDEALPVARAFAQFLHLANIAEQHHRVRRRRAYQQDPTAHPQRGSCEDSFARLLASGITPDRLDETVCALRIELVLTAHPTEVARRRIVQKHNRIARALATRDRPDLTLSSARELVASSVARLKVPGARAQCASSGSPPIDEAQWPLIVSRRACGTRSLDFARTLDRARERARVGVCRLTPRRFASAHGLAAIATATLTSSRRHAPRLLAVAMVAADLYLDEIDALRDELSLDAARSSSNGGRRA